MKAILLTSTAGQAQPTAAQAVANTLTERGVNCEILDPTLFLGENVPDAIAGVFFNVSMKTPRAFSYLYQPEDFSTADKRKSPVYYANALYAENLHRYLVDHGVDAVICSHLFPAEAITYLRRKQDLAIRAYFIPTDYTCIPFLEETDMDAIFVPHEDLVPLFIRRGVPADSLIVSGIPVLSKYRHTTNQADARTALDLPPDVPCYLVMADGVGCGDPMTLTRKLIERCKGVDVRIIIMTGRNAQLGESLRRRFEGDPRVVTVPFSEQLSLYMDACDVLFIRPHGASSTEAAIKGIPMIHTAPASGVDILNAQFFAERGMSILTPNADSAADNAIRLGQDARQRARIREAQQQYMIENAVERICNIICGGEYLTPPPEEILPPETPQAASTESPAPAQDAPAAKEPAAASETPAIKPTAPEEPAMQDSTASAAELAASPLTADASIDSDQKPTAETTVPGSPLEQDVPDDKSAEPVQEETLPATAAQDLFSFDPDDLDEPDEEPVKRPSVFNRFKRKK